MKLIRAMIWGLACFSLVVNLQGELAGQANEISETPQSTIATGGRTAVARAIRLEGSISIDGRLDDLAWQDAPIISSFIQGEPFEGAEPTEPTEVRVLFDDQAIYVGALMYETNPTVIRARLARRDERAPFDHFTLSLDPNRDGLTGYQFRVSAAGAEGDRYLFSDSEEDENWDAIWDSAVQINDRGWTAEIRIPLSQIRYEAKPGEQTWGINFERRRIESNETDYFSLESRTVRGKVSQFGTIDGLHLTSATRRIEARPFFVSQYHTAQPEAGNPLFDGSELNPRGGVDLSVGIGSAFSLDATFSPDFGQVEVDPEVINLTAFETFFPEKRPFFVQDARIFDFAGGRGGHGGRGGKALFFTRRIGREPSSFGPGAADFRDRPGQTSILGAAKFTGRTNGGLSVGALAAVTGSERGQAYYTEGDSIGTFVAEPQGEFAVVRLQQDFRDGGSKMGFIATGLKRELPEDGSFDFLPSNAYSFGIDFEHQWGGARARDFRLWGFYSGSLVQGSNAALMRLQKNSNHYFQRPDAAYLSVDSTATSMFGSDWRLQLEKQGQHWTWSTWLGQQSPGFEINDAGFITTGERLDIGASIGYRQIRPGKIFRNYNLNLYTYHNLRHSLLDDVTSSANWTRAYETGSIWLSTRFTFLNNWGMNVRGSYSPESQSDSETRGGPLMTDPDNWNVSLSFNTDRNDPLSISPTVSYRQGGLNSGHEVRTGMRFSFRPLSNWEIELGPNYSVTRDGAQYVTRSNALEYTPTYGSRYVFGDIKRRSLSMETRLNVAFTPDVSFQLYVQPLLSSGDYLKYRQLAASETFDFIDFEEGTPIELDGVVTGCANGQTCTLDDLRYFDFNNDGTFDHTTSDRDFNVHSLRGNAVFRWEYRPGSQLFLVWQHNRRESLDVGNFDFGRDVNGLFSAPAENVFIVKFSQYIGL